MCGTWGRAYQSFWEFRVLVGTSLINLAVGKFCLREVNPLKEGTPERCPQKAGALELCPSKVGVLELREI
jgi:hypothetical protein